MKAIVLTAVLYNDNSYMLNLFTDELGYVTTSVKIGKRSKVRQSHIQPLTSLDVELTGKPSQKIMHITECITSKGCENIIYEPEKIITAQFLSDFLQQTLKQSQKETRLFDFISKSIIYFNNIKRGQSNFHLVFLIKLTHYLGFFPNLEGFKYGVYFDLEAGCFVHTPPIHNNYLSPNDTFNFVQFLRLDYNTMYIYTLTREQRNIFLDFIIKYYKLHISDFDNLKSLNILRQL